MSKLCCMWNQGEPWFQVAVWGKEKGVIKHIRDLFFFFLILQIPFYSGSGISCKLTESFLQHVYIHIIPATHSEILSFLFDYASYQHLL